MLSADSGDEVRRIAEVLLADAPNRAVRVEPLSNGFKAELVESAEHGQVRAGEAALGGSVRHGEV